VHLPSQPIGACKEEDMTTRHLHQCDLAKRWSMSPRTLERWRWQGQGPHYIKVGGRVLYRIEDVERFEAARVVAPAPAAAGATENRGAA
jgi:hypothetical protein